MITAWGWKVSAVRKESFQYGSGMPCMNIWSLRKASHLLVRSIV